MRCPNTCNAKVVSFIFFWSGSTIHGIKKIVVTEHNTNFAREISEILGFLQLQDVVRQRIERIITTMKQRNSILKEWPNKINGFSDWSGVCNEGCIKNTSFVNQIELHEQMHEALNEYLSNEMRHESADAKNEVSLPKFELF
jgi:hypothetical protein